MPSVSESEEEEEVPKKGRTTAVRAGATTEEISTRKRGHPDQSGDEVESPEEQEPEEPKKGRKEVRTLVEL